MPPWADIRIAPANLVNMAFVDQADGEAAARWLMTRTGAARAALKRGRPEEGLLHPDGGR